MSQDLHHNRELPGGTKVGRALEKTLGFPFNVIELVLSYLIVRPWCALLGHLDRLSYKIEGTVFREIVSHTLFPVTLIITLVIGFEMAESGVTFRSAGGFVLLLLIYAIIFAPLERLFPWSRNWLDGGNDTAVDLMMYFSGVIWSILANFVVLILALSYFAEMIEPYGHQLWPDTWPATAQVFLFILLKDFLRYWYHRALHEVPFFWRFHKVHHSVERLYWLNGIRAHPVEIVGQAVFYAIPIALLQPGPDIVMVSVLMQLSIGIFQHSNIGLKLGIWEYIFSIGDNHRYHHYPSEVGDSNYGGEFIVWDILFGTFHKPKGETPSDVIGISHAPYYPLTWMGLMIAPFLPDQRVFSAERNEASEENSGQRSEEADSYLSG